MALRLDSRFMKRPFPFGWLAAGLTLAAVTLLGISPEGAQSWLAVGAVAVIGALAVGLAWLRRTQRRRYEAALAAAAARDAVLSDRLTIARDLHDIVSHGLGAITVRAEAGQRLAAIDEQEPTRALGDVATLSRQTTDELRRLLTLLRDPDAAPLHPSPSLGDVPGLLKAARKQGLSVQATGLEVRVDSPGIELTGYQVVREALANVARHAGPTAARVALAVDAEALQVQVDDDGPAPGWRATPGAGHGLVLLGTRVDLHGGTLRYGPLGDGYRVTARIPLGPR